MKAALHPSEPARLAALRSYEILDTPRERDFDDVVALASQLCGTPISVINLIDAGRQWFKAEVGLGVRETPIDSSICAHVILEDSFVEIHDTLLDRRMRDNPLCLADPGLRFYAGALLKARDGQPIGTLCVLDYQPRALDALQRHALEVLARQVMAQIELRAALRRESLVRREIDHRVKNSLQSVGAFVQMQARAAGEGAAQDSLRAVTRQLESVAMLHDQLSLADDTATVDLGDFLRRVAGLLDATTPPAVTIAGDFVASPVTPQVAAVVGTIVNELVANSIKHGFRGNRGGRVTLGGTVDGGAYRLTCQDDAAAELAAKATKPDGLGLRIINASVRQLGGALTSGATEFGFGTELSFPLRRA